MSSTAATGGAWSDRPAEVDASRIVVMGVSGCGKSTVGRALAQALRIHFVEGDELHSLHNVQLMAAGTPLTDADRHGWLQEVAAQLGNATAQARGVVVSCSALKRSYRDLLRASAPGVQLVYLQGPAEVLRARLGRRAGHYMPPSLLQSQLDTLEPPSDDEAPIVADIRLAPQDIVARVVQQLNVAQP
jgi:carbohydrate kinase (thermoresistant glucokinase family)